MKLTSIKQQVKNPDRVSIYVEGKYVFSLSLDELVKYKLAKGREFTEAELKKFKKISEDGKLRMRSLEWLLNRPHTIREFKDYLYKKKADPQFSEQLIEEFCKKGYLDDAKFAEWFIGLKQKKNKSRRGIRAELLKKGIGGEMLEQSMQSEQIDEEAALKNLIDRKSAQGRYREDPLKLAKYLTSQGFSYDLVKKHLAKDRPED